FWVVSREGGDARRITEGGPFHSGYAVSPNGRRLVYADVDEDLVIVDVDTGERDLFLGMTEPIDEASPVWLPE
ncbi:MAG: TolB family protein, partial [Gemmatimonadota bacterium]